MSDALQKSCPACGSKQFTESNSNRRWFECWSRYGNEKGWFIQSVQCQRLAASKAMTFTRTAAFTTR